MDELLWDASYIDQSRNFSHHWCCNFDYEFISSLSNYIYCSSILPIKDLDLRLQHFHSFSKSVWGGHYHIDTTPDIAEYEGFFNIGEKIVRIDKPINTHQFGRD